MKARPLLEGATIGIIAPGGPPANPAVINESIHFLETLGFHVKLGLHATDRHGFLAGKDQSRVRDLLAMFKDPSVDAIMALRGGYGSIRLLPLLDFDIIKAHPKIFIGFSDITALHAAIYKRTKLITFHGPMAVSLMAPQSEFALRATLEALMGVEESFSLCENYSEQPRTVEIIRHGVVRGVLIGGNLSLLVSLIGTPYEPSFRGKILFLEDVGEAPYRIDRMLTQLLLSGALDGVKGIALGLFEGCEDRFSTETAEYRQSVSDVVSDRLAPLKVPLVLGLPFGHVEANGTLPYGGTAVLDANEGDLIIDRAVEV